MEENALPLKDLHLPAEIGWWPLAPGWWGVIAVLAVVAAAVILWVGGIVFRSLLGRKFDRKWLHGKNTDR